MPVTSHTPEPFLVHYEDEEYDLGEFLDSHPAGRNVLLPFRNRDITRKFADIGHSGMARKILDKHRVKGTKLNHDDPALNQGRTKQQTQFVLKKLFTSDDPVHFHKVLGFLCLLSFAYRYLYVLPTTGTLGMTGTTFDMLTLLVHFLLSASSLIFHVIEKRIPNRPLIIYEEYRLHAIVFTTRCILVSLIGFYCEQMEEITRRFVLGFTILGVHLVVDYITAVHGTRGVTAVRNDGVRAFKYLGYFYSFYQMAALATHLTWNGHLGDLGYNALIAIQSSAFLMTLKRKSLIGWYSHALWYSLALVLSYYVMWSMRGGFMFFVYPAVLFFVRVMFNTNKYLLWAVYALCVYMIPAVV